MFFFFTGKNAYYPEADLTHCQRSLGLNALVTYQQVLVYMGWGVPRLVALSKPIKLSIETCSMSYCEMCSNGCGVIRF